MKIAGVDEVGIGCLAGPLVSAAVIFGKNKSEYFFKDSKKTSQKNRVIQAKYIKRNFFVGIGLASPSEIDELNVLQASHLAMKRAIKNLPVIPDRIIIDGIYIPEGLEHAEAIIKGDEQYQEIAAASIVAKVYRDNLMHEMDLEYPGFNFSKHKGYPTAEHLNLIKEFGPSKIHRMTFKGVK